MGRRYKGAGAAPFASNAAFSFRPKFSRIVVARTQMRSMNGASTAAKRLAIQCGLRTAELSVTDPRTRTLHDRACRCICRPIRRFDSLGSNIIADEYDASRRERVHSPRVGNFAVNSDFQFVSHTVSNAAEFRRVD